jgi:serine/threonine-protein kinase
MSAIELDKDQWQQLKAVLTTALKLSASERVAMLDRAFAHDPALRACALDMLQYYDGASKPFDTSDTNRLSADRAAERPATAVRPGDSVGNYRVLRQLGSGGMGVVYLAEDARLGRRVALKFMLPDVRGTLNDAKAQLLDESRSAAHLNHPVIVTLHDVFEVDDELVTVMEYVEGRPLGELIAGEPMPLGFALRLIGQLADGLAYAHGHGVVHCDLKPANIHVLPSGAPKILDFGLARLLAGASTPAREVERPLFGTPGYLAPERLLGREPTAASDVYALGVIFYELLTGQPPFRLDDDGQLFLDTITAAPLPPSRIAGGIPPSVDGLALRCLAKSPRERLQAHELSRALTDVLRQIETAPIPLPPAAQEGVVHGIRSIADGDGARAASKPVTSIAIGLIVSVALVGAVTMLGFVTSFSYRQPLGLVGAFSNESALLLPVWGVRSMVAVAGWSAILAVYCLAAVGVCRLSLFAIRPLARRIEPGLTSARAQLANAVDGTPVATLASLLLLAQLAFLAWLAWRFQPILVGLDNFITRSQPVLDALGPQNHAEHRILGEMLATGVFVFGLGWYWLLRVARGRAIQDGRSYIWAGIAVTIAGLLLFQTVPFRLLYHNTAERVSFRSERCYLVGQRADDVGLFCPNRPPPWTQIVKGSDPALARDGELESIFSTPGK